MWNRLRGLLPKDDGRCQSAPMGIPATTGEEVMRIDILWIIAVMFMVAYGGQIIINLLGLK
jgi:hypothetical protein